MKLKAGKECFEDFVVIGFGTERSILDDRWVYDERGGLYCFLWYKQAKSLKFDSPSSTKNPAVPLRPPYELPWPALAP